MPETCVASAAVLSHVGPTPTWVRGKTLLADARRSAAKTHLGGRPPLGPPIIGPSSDVGSSLRDTECGKQVEYQGGRPNCFQRRLVYLFPGPDGLV